MKQHHDKLKCDARGLSMQYNLTHLLIQSIIQHQRKYYSGLAIKNMIDCGAGVVDADYRGNIGIILFNFGQTDFEVNIGDRIGVENS